MAPTGSFVGLALLLAAAGACAAPMSAPASTSPSGPAAGNAPAASAARPAAPAAASAAAAAPVHVVASHLPATHSGGLYIALERGYFAEQGLDVELQPSFASSESLALLNSGALDVYGGATGANLYNAVARGVHLRAVADKAHSEPGIKYKAIMVRKDLWDSGAVRTMADLRGRPFGGLPGGGSTEFQSEKLLQTGGVLFSEVDFKPLTTPDQLAALANKSIDAVFTFQPALCTAERLGLAVAMPPYMDDIAPGLEGGVINYGEQFMRDKPQAARGFMVAYVRALRDYNDAQLHNVNRPLIVDILQKYVNLPDLSYYDDCEWGRLYPDGRINRASIEDEVQWSVKAGFMDRPISVDQLVDDQWVDYAVAQLGPYQPGGR
ncbi:MAG TPA: ABC transporter substrate-binding protein [Chloroflexota bacterium]|nr:ABC transporter substrate-binding protein [Chloroflexota bacterium]